jgi:hypothetical protein
MFDGEVSPWPYALYRMAIAAVVLVRTTDVLRPLLPLLHHAWVAGLEYDPRVEKVAPPALRSPLVPGLTIPDALALVLVWARTILAALLLLGVRVRTVAFALMVVGLGLMAADRYRYFHHILLLYVGVGWLALAPGADRLGVMQLGHRRWHAEAWVPRWPLQLMRLFTMSVYLAAGTAKLSSDWLSGKTLAQLTALGLVGGRPWQWLVAHVGASPLAIGIAGAELGLPVLLAAPRTRLGGVVLGVALHAGISTAMSVSTFGVEMVLLLSLFLPWPERAAARAT